MSKQNTKKTPGMKGALFNCTGLVRIDNFDCLNSSLYFISILQRTCEKKLWRTYAYSLTSALLP